MSERGPGEERSRARTEQVKEGRKEQAEAGLSLYGCGPRLERERERGREREREREREMPCLALELYRAYAGERERARFCW